jgi:hypothetical protein
MFFDVEHKSLIGENVPCITNKPAAALFVVSVGGIFGVFFAWGHADASQYYSSSSYQDRLTHDSTSTSDVGLAQVEESGSSSPFSFLRYRSGLLTAPTFPDLSNGARSPRDLSFPLFAESLIEHEKSFWSKASNVLTRRHQVKEIIEEFKVKRPKFVIL